MDAVIYTRISKDRTGAGLGVDRQEEDCRALAQRLGWTVVAVHSDNDISAYSGKTRPGFEALLASPIKRVVVWHQDRLLRLSSDLERVLDAGLTVHTVQAGTLDLATSTGKAVARTVAAWSTYEIEQSRDRMLRAKQQAAANGRYRGGRRPFGYEADGVTIRQDEAQALSQAAQGLLEGRTLLAMVRALNVPTTGGRPMTGVALRNILLRPRNAGLIEVAGEIVGQAAWPAILEEDIWRGVVAILKDPTRKTTPGPERKWLGSGLFICGQCGLRMKTHRSPSLRTVYTCQPSKHVARDQEAVDGYVQSEVAKRLDEPDLADLLAPEAVDLGPVRTEAAGVRARLDEAAAAYGQGVITLSQMTTATETLRGRLEALEGHLAQAHQGSVLGALSATQVPSVAFLAAPLDVRRQIIDSLCEVTIFPGRRGRPAGWKPGQPYADLATVKVRWRSSAEHGGKHGVQH